MEYLSNTRGLVSLKLKVRRQSPYAWISLLALRWWIAISKTWGRIIRKRHIYTYSIWMVCSISNDR